MISVKNLKNNLRNGKYDGWLSHVYCKPITDMTYQRDRIIRIAEEFCHTFEKTEETEVAIFSAPGRTELGGNHTDHQRGKVLTGSVDLDALCAAAPNGTEMVNICSEGYGMTSISSRELAKVDGEENTTVSLIRGILSAVVERGYTVSGFDAYITSDVPGGSGLSSSACFEVLIGVILNGLFCKGELALHELAQIGQYAENVYFGKPSGLMDQMGCAMGGMISIDFRDKDHPDFHQIDFDFMKTGHALCIIDTGADHADMTDDYAAIPAEMKAVAAYFGKEVLCEVDEEEFRRCVPEIRRQTGDRAILRALHYFTDCRRVDRMVTALEQDNFAAYLRQVSSSGHSSYMFLQNITTGRDPAEQPVAVALAMAGSYLNGEGARRVHGGGFAGTIQAYVPLPLLESFREGMDALLGEGACRVTSIRPVGGCTLID